MSTKFYNGTVKSWIEHLGFGYVAISRNYEDDIFIGRAHVPARNGKRKLFPGEAVCFQLDLKGRTLKAVNLTFEKVEGALDQMSHQTTAPYGPA